MADRIELSPAELLAQSAEMQAIKDEFENLFSQTSGILKNLNSSWSPNLANNFLGKITSAGSASSAIVGLLEKGAMVAKTSAETFQSVDGLIARDILGGDVRTGADAYTAGGGNGAFGGGDGGGGFRGGGSEESFFDDMRASCTGISNAVVSKSKKIISNIKDSYENKGKAYKAVQYGKSALKVGAGVVKAVGAVATFPSPLSIIAAMSAAEDIGAGINDAIFTHYGLYEDIGSTHPLKDYLTKHGREFGECFGDPEKGEYIGELLYDSVNIISFLNGADKMLKNFGKVNTIVTGSTGDSFVWGHTGFDDVMDTKIKFSFEPDYFIRKCLGVQGASDANIVYEAGKSVFKTIKSGKKAVSGLLGTVFE